MKTGLGVAVVAVVIVSLARRTSVKIVRDYQRFVVFRLGRSLGAKGALRVSSYSTFWPSSRVL